jgi:transcriptional regulator with XRE-family HTH domain
MQAAVTLRRARLGAGLSLRALAARAGTSHSTLAAYESGRKVPSVDTVQRIVEAAGFELDVALSARLPAVDLARRGEELLEVLDLAAQFPIRPAGTLTYPRFGSTGGS